MWLNELKKALILQEYDKLNHLISSIPQFQTLEELEEATYLLHQTLLLLEAENSAILINMQQIKNTLDFIKSAETTLPRSLNLKL